MQRNDRVRFTRDVLDHRQRKLAKTGDVGTVQMYYPYCCDVLLDGKKKALRDVPNSNLEKI
jgi:hypothetical protein